MKRLPACALAIALSAFILWSCRKSRAKPQWDVDVLAPLAVMQVDISKLSPADPGLSITGTNNPALIYTGQLFSIELDTLFAIPDTDIVYQYSIAPLPSTTFTPGTQFYSSGNEALYDLDQVKLNTALMRSGQIVLDVQNDFNETVMARIKLAGATKNGDTLIILEAVPPNSTISKSYKLDGYLLDLRGSSLNTYNTIISDVTTYIDSAAPAPVTVTSSEILKMTIGFRSMVPQYIRGYFGNYQEQSGPVSTGNPVFTNITGGSIALDSAMLNFRIQNEVGADLRATVNNISGTGPGGNTVTLNHSMIGQQLNIGRAVDLPPGSSNVQVAELDFYMDQDNSNVNDFIANIPSSFTYDIDFDINPLGDVSGGNDFVYYGGGISATLDATIPLRLTANNVVFEDTFLLRPGSVDSLLINPDYNGYLYVLTDNGFPFNLGATFYLLDASFNITDTIVMTGTIQSAETDANGDVITPYKSWNTIAVSNNLAGSLNRAYAMSVVLSINSYGTSSVHIRDDQKAIIKLVGDINYTVNSGH